jgi:hypothetical protein
MKPKPPKWQLTVRIDPRGKKFKQLQVFEVRAKSKDAAEAELVRVFHRCFAIYHGWGPRILAVMLVTRLKESAPGRNGKAKSTPNKAILRAKGGKG